MTDRRLRRFPDQTALIYVNSESNPDDSLMDFRGEGFKELVDWVSPGYLAWQLCQGNRCPGAGLWVWTGELRVSGAKDDIPRLSEAIGAFRRPTGAEYAHLSNTHTTLWEPEGLTTTDIERQR